MTRQLFAHFVLIAFVTQMSFAEDEVLRLRNTGGQREIEFLYRSVEDRFGPMNRVTLIGKEEKRITLIGKGPFDVMVRFPPQDKTGTLHTCFSQPIALDVLANTGAVVDLRSVPAQGQNGARQITQADLGVNGKTVPVIRKPTTATAFAKQGLTGQWNSTYVAIDGSIQQSRDSFETLIMEGTGYRGQMSDVLAVENKDGLYLVGRWAALGDSGDFYLFIDKQRPTELKGHYTQDGDPTGKKYEWTGTKVP